MSLGLICIMKDEEINRMAEFEEGYWWFLGRQKIIVSILERQNQLRTDSKILDVGCGTGGTTLALKKFGSVYGIDSSFSALKYSNQRGLDKVLKSSVYDLPFKAETFDLITILDSLEHIEDDIRVLKELKRILKKDGIIFIAVPAFQFLWSEHDIALSHFRRYSSKTLKSVTKQAGLQYVWSSYIISFLFPFIAVYRIVSRIKQNKSNPKPTLVSFPNFINKIFQKILFLESKILQKSKLPFGLSLICISKINSSESLS